MVVVAEDRVGSAGAVEVEGDRALVEGVADVVDEVGPDVEGAQLGEVRLEEGEVGAVDCW